MKDVYETLHQLVEDRDWQDLAALSIALMSGEWDTMSKPAQDELLAEINGEYYD